jgi:DNA-binding IclR family transcriptional regulator
MSEFLSEDENQDAAGTVAKEVRVRAVPAVTRAVAILRLLGRSNEPLGVNRIARELRLVPSTALHILRVLIGEELVAMDPQTKRYELDAGILTLARSVLRRNGFAEKVQPSLNSLAQRYKVTMLGVQVIGLEHMVVVAMAPSSLPVRLHVDLGSRFPALISATGRCLAAFGRIKAADLESRFRKLSWANALSFGTWQAQVQEAKALGYSFDDGNYIAGVMIVAVPVIGRSGRMTHSIVAIGLREQIRETGIARIAQDMRTISAGLERDTERDPHS